MLGTEAITVCRVNAVRTWLQQLPVFRMYVWRILCCSEIVSSQKGNSSVGTTKLSVVSNVNAERLTCWLKRHHYEPTPFC